MTMTSARCRDLFRSIFSTLTAIGLAIAPGPARAEDPAIEYAIAPGGLQVKTSEGTRELPIADCEPKAIAHMW